MTPSVGILVLSKLLRRQQSFFPFEESEGERCAGHGLRSPCLAGLVVGLRLEPATTVGAGRCGGRSPPRRWPRCASATPPSPLASRPQPGSRTTTGKPWDTVCRRRGITCSAPCPRPARRARREREASAVRDVGQCRRWPQQPRAYGVESSLHRDARPQVLPSIRGPH